MPCIFADLGILYELNTQGRILIPLRLSWLSREAGERLAEIQPLLSSSVFGIGPDPAQSPISGRRRIPRRQDSPFGAQRVSILFLRTLGQAPSWTFPSYLPFAVTVPGERQDKGCWTAALNLSASLSSFVPKPAPPTPALVSWAQRCLQASAFAALSRGALFSPKEPIYSTLPASLSIYFYIDKGYRCHAGF